MAAQHDFQQIIIGGLQRSGTSLLRAILGSHSQIGIYQWDVPLWIEFYPVYGNRKLSKKLAIQMIDELLALDKVRLCDVQFERTYFINRIQSQNKPIYFEHLYLDFLKYYQTKIDAKYIGLKTPFNEFYADDIFKRFPNTKFVHVLRNPLDAATSLKEAKSKWWGGEINYYEHIQNWEYSASKASERLKKYANKYYVLRYEDLIAQPAFKTKEICDFLSVQFEPTMLKMQGQPGWKGNNSSFGKETKTAAFSTSSINRYRTLLVPKVQRQYIQILGNLLDTFDYLPEGEKVKLKRPLAYRLNSFRTKNYEQLLVSLKRWGIYDELYKLKSAIIRK